MATFRAFWLAVLTGMALLFPASRAASTNLVFDAITKEYHAKQGERTVEFVFSLTNTGPEEITIKMVRASCGCTTPKLPPLPWKLEPGAGGSFQATVDLAGKFGTFQKSIFLDTSEGPKLVYTKVIIEGPTNSMAMPGVDARTRNMQIAAADPTAIFRGECANCHSKPAMGKKGEELFTAACAICHESELRAVLVPDLHALKQPPSAAYWEAWIRNGKAGTMMPGFALDKKGPLSDEQIESLVSYMMSDFPKRVPHGKTVSAPAAKPIARASAATKPIVLPGDLPLLPPPPTPTASQPPTPAPSPTPSN